MRCVQSLIIAALQRKRIHDLTNFYTIILTSIKTLINNRLKIEKEIIATASR